MVLFQAPEPTKAPARRTRKTAAAKAAEAAAAEQADATLPTGDAEPEAGADGAEARAARKPAKKSTARTRTGTAKAGTAKSDTEQAAEAAEPETGTPEAATSEAGAAEADKTDVGQPDEEKAETAGDGEESEGGGRRRRRRGGRRRRKSSDGTESSENAEGAPTDETAAAESSESGESAAEETPGEGSSRRRRRRRRSGDEGGDVGDDPQNTVTRVRSKRSAEDEITAVSGSTRLEAKKQRRREGREAGRRRAPIVSEAEFLARRESVERVMVIRQREELTQIGVLEDKVLVEHYVARESQTSLIGNVYLGRVQNVLPSMEAAFIDIGKGRNAVLYAGEVNWSALGHREGQPRKIESVLSSGQSVLVQVTKDPIGHKGARLTSQISLAGRFLVYVPDGTTSGISRKLPDTERNRLKALLKEIVPDSAGVIVRTAAEGASEDELTRDVERLKARWEDIEKKSKGSAPQMLYGEPDLTLKVVRDLFTEDFAKLVIQGDDAWDTVQNYVAHVAPDLEERLERFEPGESGKDIFATYRIDEQIAKGLDRKVWLPSGGSLIIDRTEAMTVVDVNTGKFTGSGGNLEETVTKNNLEAAEEIVRQLRLRDIGGIIVVDFIDMVLESNRDLVLRRLVECLGRDRTRHQVAEVTSLGLVQMTRKRIGTGLVESFSENCEHCQGRGVVIHEQPVEPKRGDDESRRGGRRSRGGRGRGQDGDAHSHDAGNEAGKAPSPKDLAAAAKPDGSEKASADGTEHAAEGTGRRQPEKKSEQKPDRQLDQQAGQKSDQKSGQKSGQEPAADRKAAEEPVRVAAETAPEPTRDQPAEPAAPKVVTRTRRRAASRPAGQPEQQSAPQPVVVDSAPAPVAVAAPVSAEPTVVEKPKVVTRTRGRSASRPAGPPAAEAAKPVGAATAGEVPSMATTTVPPTGVGSVGAPPQHGAVEPGTAVAEPGHDAASTDEDHHVEHVPIKKKGSRKR
jgi:ribonuclease E